MSNSEEREIGLHELGIGEKGRVLCLGAEGAFRRRLLDLGLVEGAEVKCTGRSPLGDPIAFLIRGAVIALRAHDCRTVIVLREG